MSNDRGKNKESWAVGGGVIIGVGVGFFLLHQSALYFVGSIMVGLGLGLVASAILSKIK
ncbi:MAG: hypothetical protein V7782_01470 [Psychromonas sp.]